jgi:cytochrome c
LICIKERRAPACHPAVYDIDEKLTNMRQISSLLLTTSLFLASTYDAAAQSVQRGAEIARANCARCHSIERSGVSPFPPAPPFRMLHEKYPVETLEEALGEGIVTGHPAMPEFQLEPRQIGDFIAFLKSLE